MGPHTGVTGSYTREDKDKDEDEKKDNDTDIDIEETIPRHERYYYKVLDVLSDFFGKSRL